MSVFKAIIIFVIIGSLLSAVNLWLYFKPSEIELHIANWLRFGSPLWLLEIILLLTDTIFALATAAAIYTVWLVWKSKYISAFTLAISLSSIYFIDAIKSIIQRPRPFLEYISIEPFAGNSFPSGHAFVSLLISGVLVLLISTLYPEKSRKMLISLAVGYSLLIGWTRVYLQAHFLSDILGGFVFASFLLLIIGLTYKWSIRKFGRY